MHTSRFGARHREPQSSREADRPPSIHTCVWRASFQGWTGFWGLGKREAGAASGRPHSHAQLRPLQAWGEMLTEGLLLPVLKTRKVTQPPRGAVAPAVAPEGELPWEQDIDFQEGWGSPFSI